MKHLHRALALVSLAVLAAPSWAQFAKAEDAIKPAVGAVGNACKTCHDAFRKD